MGCAEPQLSSLNRNLFVTCALRAPDRLFGGFLGAREGTQNVFHIGVVGHTIEGAADFVRGIAT
jgi:hypothetical protein